MRRGVGLLREVIQDTRDSDDRPIFAAGKLSASVLLNS